MEGTESRIKHLEGSDCTTKLPIDALKRVVKYILHEKQDIFSRRRIDMGRSTEFKVKLTSKNDIIVYSQISAIPIQLLNE